MSADTRRVRVLVVEDDEPSAYLVRFVLEREGYDVQVAGDGLEGIENAQSRQPDVVLVDIMLPSVDGYEVTRQLRALYGRGLPIIALTAHTMKGVRESVLAAGCDGFLSKPLDPQELVDTVREVLERAGKD